VTPTCRGTSGPRRRRSDPVAIRAPGSDQPQLTRTGAPPANCLYPATSRRLADAIDDFAEHAPRWGPEDHNKLISAVSGRTRWFPRWTTARHRRGQIQDIIALPMAQEVIEKLEVVYVQYATARGRRALRHRQRVRDARRGTRRFGAPVSASVKRVRGTPLPDGFDDTDPVPAARFRRCQRFPDRTACPGSHRPCLHGADGDVDVEPSP